MPATLLSQLRLATTDAHAELENVTNLPHALRSIEDLQQFLVAFLGFYRPLDKHLAQVADTTGFELPYDTVKRSRLLEIDLCSFGMPLEAVNTVAVCRDLPEFTSRHDLLGAHYVIEGSSLGGRVLQRHIDNHMNSPQLPGSIHYFSAYGDNSADRWQHFKRWANELDQTKEQVSSSIAAALALFHSLTEWYRCVDARTGAVDG